MNLLESNSYEGLKAGFHSLILIIMLVALVYNFLAYTYRNDKDLSLWMGIVIYSFMTFWEFGVLIRHIIGGK